MMCDQPDGAEADGRQDRDWSLDHPLSLSIFVLTCLGVVPYNWTFVVGRNEYPFWIIAPLSIIFIYSAALSSIPAGASLKTFAKHKIRKLHHAVYAFSLLLLVFVVESMALPSIRVAWDRSALLAVISGGTIAIQLLVTSYLQKIVWDRAVELMIEQTSKP